MLWNKISYTSGVVCYTRERVVDSKEPSCSPDSPQYPLGQGAEINLLNEENTCFLQQLHETVHMCRRPL